MVERKAYLTGGLGSRHDGEAFGEPYELPPDAPTARRCAAIASVSGTGGCCWPPGEARFADLIERTLYNGFLAGVSLDGSDCLYVNPLARAAGRAVSAAVVPVRVLPAQRHAAPGRPGTLPGHRRTPAACRCTSTRAHDLAAYACGPASRTTGACGSRWREAAPRAVDALAAGARRGAGTRA